MSYSIYKFMTKRGTTAVVILAAVVFLSFFTVLEYYSEDNIVGISGSAIAGTNTTTNGTAYLEIKDQHERIGFGPNVSVLFFANYSNSTSGEAITTGNCIIEINDSTSATMTYNSSYDKFVYSHPGFSQGVYSWNVTCNDTIYNTTFTTDNITIHDHWLIFDPDFSINMMGLVNGSALLLDYDNDTYLDLFVTGINESGNKHTFLYRNNKTEFVDSGFSFTGVSHSDEVVMFLDSDNYPEIIYCGADSSGNPVTEIKSYDGSTFSAYSNDNLEDVSNCSLARLDFNKDQKTDLLLQGYNGTNNVGYLYINNGTELVLNKTFAGAQTSEFIVYDLNNDTYEDFFVLGSAENFAVEISDFYFNVNGSNITSNITYALSNAVNYPEVALFDINGDENDDLFVSGQDNGGNALNTLYIYNETSQKFEDKTATHISGLDSTVSRGCVGAADFTGNGYLDLYVSGINPSIIGSNASIYTNDGTQLTYNASMSKGLIYNKYGSCVFGDIDKASNSPDYLMSGAYCEYVPPVYQCINDGSSYTAYNSVVTAFGSYDTSNSVTSPLNYLLSSLLYDGYCGDGIVDIFEECDGSNLDGETCASQLGSGYTGTLTCSACSFDTSACVAPSSSPSTGGSAGGSSVRDDEPEFLFIDYTMIFYSNGDSETRQNQLSYTTQESLKEAFLSYLTQLGISEGDIDYILYNEMKYYDLDSLLEAIYNSGSEDPVVIIIYLKEDDETITFELVGNQEELNQEVMFILSAIKEMYGINVEIKIISPDVITQALVEALTYTNILYDYLFPLNLLL